MQAAGTLWPTVSRTTGRTFVMSGGGIDVTGATYTLSGAQVLGYGYLTSSGGGGFAVGSGGATLSGQTVFNGTSFGTTAGPLSLTNTTFGGSATVPAGQALTVNRLNLDAGGAVTVGGTAAVARLTSYGQLNVSPGGSLTNSGTDLVLGGGSRTVVGAVGAGTTRT